MPYPKNLLADHETVQLDVHPHWWTFAEPAAALVASVVLGIVAKWQLDGDTEKWVVWLAIILIAISAIWLVIRYLQWSTTNFVITSNRIIYRSGILAKSGIEIPRARVNNVLFNQSVLERIFGAGDLLIESGGEVGQQRFTNVRQPERVKNLITSYRETGSGSGSSASSDVATQLEKLEGLLERGTITREDFEAQKDKLLGS